MTCEADVLAQIRTEFQQDVEMRTVGNYILVKFNKWVPNEEFADVAHSLEAVNGEWKAGLGRESHFAVPVSKAVSGSASDLEAKVVKLQETLKAIIESLEDIRKHVSVPKPS